MEYQLEGNGPVIVLIHGLFGDLNNLASLGRELRENGYQTLRISLRNHGGSPQFDSMTQTEMADDLEQLRQQLHIRQWSLIGHSLGGKVAMTYAQKHPDQTQALVVADIAPVTYPPSHHTILSELTKIQPAELSSRQQAQQQLLDADLDPGVVMFLTKNLVPADGGGFRWRMHIDAITKNYPHLITAPNNAPPYSKPTLFIKGSESDYLSPQHQSEVIKRFPAATARVIQGTGHWLHAEKPRLFNNQVIRFLQSAIS